MLTTASVKFLQIFVHQNPGFKWGGMWRKSAIKIRSKGKHVERGEVISRAERRKLSEGGIRRKSRKAGSGQFKEST